MTVPRRPDVIDRAAGLAAADPLFETRALRQEFLLGAEACRMSLLEPDDDLSLPRDLRRAIGRRVIATGGNAALLAEYDEAFQGQLAVMADGGMPEDAYLAAIAKHTDLIAAEPAKSNAASLTALRDAGLTVPQIVALSELLAFFCFQIRIVAGLNLLGLSK